MKNLLVYQSPGRAPQVAAFIDGLEPRQLHRLSATPPSGLREPHYKHFSVEKYRSLYEVRERCKIIIRIIFTIRPDGEILLLHAFIKRRSRDTMQALEQSLRILSELRRHPEYAVEYKIKEEESS